MECSRCDNDADNDGKSESSLVATGSEHGSMYIFIYFRTNTI
jgi:hypothetical protein